MLFPLKLPAGMVKSGTKYQSKGRWYDGSLVRFANGAIGPIGGWQVLEASAMGPTTVASDSFTGTNGTTLASHSPSGSPNAFTWSACTTPVWAGLFEIQSNKLQLTADANWWVTFFGAFGVSDYVPDSTDYSASVSLTFPTTTTRDWTGGVAVRYDDDGVHGDFGYLVVVKRTAAGAGSVEFRISDGDSGYLTPADVQPFTVTTGVEHTLRVEVTGTGIDTVLTAYWDDTEILTSNPVDDAWSGHYYDAIGSAAIFGAVNTNTGTGQLLLDGFAIGTLDQSTITLDGVPRAILGWRGNDGSQSIGIGTNTKLYAHWLGILYDITPDTFTPGTVDAEFGSGGYGDGLYGVGPYGVSDPAQTTYDPPAVWHLDTFGDYLVGVCSPNDGNLVFWDRSPSSVAEPMPNAPTNVQGVVVTPERFVVALGVNSGSAAGVRRIEWASQETLDEWTPSSTNTAGGDTLEGRGAIVCGRRAKDETLIWTTDDLWTLRYIGGTLVYATSRLGGNCGIASPGAVAQFDVNAVWMSQRSFFIYDGFVRPLECAVADFIFSEDPNIPGSGLNRAQIGKVTCAPTSEFGEIRWHYPSAGSDENDRYVTWNYRENHWSVGELERTAGCDAGALEYPVWGSATGKLYEHEKSFDHTDPEGNTLTPFLESGPVELVDGDRVLSVSQIVPDERTQGDTELSLYTSFYPDESEVLHGPFTTNKLTDARFTGRWARARIDQVNGVDWRVGVIRFDGTPGGRR